MDKLASLWRGGGGGGVDERFYKNIVARSFKAKSKCLQLRKPQKKNIREKAKICN